MIDLTQYNCDTAPVRKRESNLKRRNKQRWCLLPALENLGVRDARIGHVRVDSALAMPMGTSSCAARHGLVISKSVVPKADVVHATLGGGTHFEGPEDYVDNPLRCEHIATYHGCVC